MEELVFIKNDKYFIPGILSYPEHIDSKLPAIILLHGNLSCKNGDGFILTKIAERLKDNNIVSLRIDYCSCGESRRSRKEYNVLTICHEVKLAYEYLSNLTFIDKEKIGLMGHSYGGTIAFKCANLNPKCIISLNGDMARSYKEEYESYKDKFVSDEEGDKYVIIRQSDTRYELMYEQFYINELKNEGYDHYDGNVLVCIAVDDPSLDPIWGYKFFNELDNKHKTLLEIEGANHTFNAKTLDYTKLNELMDKVNKWLDENLK